jgi:hypothetical protein
MKRQPDLFDGGGYPDKPGHKSHDDTTLAAAEAIASRAATLRAKAYAMLKVRRMTADECADTMGESVLAIRPRFSELRTKGLIRDTGNRRPNRSGHSAIVWEIT